LAKGFEVGLVEYDEGCPDSLLHRVYLWPADQPGQCLDIASTIVHRLTAAEGAVVIVPVAHDFVPSQRVKKAISDIVADRTAVFAVENGFNSSAPPDRNLDNQDKQAWWVKHPFLSR
jgi:hypothetical protein